MKRSKKVPRVAATRDDALFKRTLELRGRDFSFDPRRLEMRAESGGGQHGLTFDDWGHKFVCANSSHIQTLMYEERYAALNRASTLPRALVEIAEDGGAAPVFRLSPDEPWRVLRTQWRVAGMVPGPIEGGGRPSGYFTGATGVTIYRGDAYGADFLGDAFIGDAGGNLVHRKKVMVEGVTFKAVRPADERDVEFLASTDNWFRPVQFANAPDGCLYVCDMYREVIEHPWSLPQSLKQHLDLNSGNDQGRIYRIVPEKFTQPRRPRLSSLSTRKLVDVLELANGWHRDAAARLIYERQDPTSVPALKGLLLRTKVPIVRTHALCALAGQGALEWTELSRALSDTSPQVRFHGVRLSERFSVRDNPALASKLTDLARDPEETVRRQLAFTAGLLPREERMATVEALLTNGPAWDHTDALFNSVGEEAITIFRRLAARDPSLDMRGLDGLAGRIGKRRQPGEVTEVIDALLVAAALPRRPLRFEYRGVLRVTDALARGLESAGGSIRQLDSGNRTAPLFTLARDWMAKPWAPADWGASGESPNWPAISVLGAAPYEEAGPVLLVALEKSLLETTEILTALSRCSGSGGSFAKDLLARWTRLPPQAKEQAVPFLLKRAASIQELLAAIEKGSVPRDEISVAQRSFLQSHQDKEIRQKAVGLFGERSTANRQAVIESYRRALDLRGTAANGQKHFRARCASCHRVAGAEGFALGPDLVTVRNGGREKILTSLIDPNREMNGNFAACLIETKDGETLLGIVAGENASSVTLRMAGGMTTVLPRDRIATRQNQDRSLMPEGLEEGLSMQDMADLLEFVLTGP
jgi:putative heme-binding domain-containing protein